MALYRNTCMYIGSGKPERYKHINSGISHCYQANKHHFRGEVCDIEITHTDLSKEESLNIEKDMIEKLNPVWNCLGGNNPRASLFKEDILKLFGHRQKISKQEEMCNFIYQELCGLDKMEAHVSQIEGKYGVYSGVLAELCLGSRTKNKKAQMIFEVSKVEGKIGCYTIKYWGLEKYSRAEIRSVLKYEDEKFREWLVEHRKE